MNGSTPKLSVIVPNYNHAQFLKQRIDSVLGQSFQDFELIILDDSSSDNSRDIIEAYRNHPKVRHIIYNENNSGSAFKQWLKGISLAQGEWVWIAESDDWAEQFFLERMIRAIGENPSCGLAYCWSFYTDEKGNQFWPIADKNKTVLHRGKTFLCESLILYNCIVNVSSCLFKRELFEIEKVKLYEHMRLCGDWFFYVLLAEKADVVEIMSPLNYCRRHGTNISEDAESRGLSFLEGADILDYIVARYSVRQAYYSKFWGKKWAKYKERWGFSHEMDVAIRKRFQVNHKAIIGFYIIYTVRLFVRKWRK